MAKRGIAGLLAHRLSRRPPEVPMDETDCAWVARILATLFGLGGTLLLATLLFDGTAERETEQLIVVAVAGLAVGVFILSTHERLPMWFLRGAPAIGTLLVALAVYYAGEGAAAPYALYMAWVVIAAALFLSMGLTLAHGAIAVAAYAFVLTQLDGSDGLDPLRIAMLAGTVLAIAVVMNGIAGQMREVLQRLEAAARTDPLTGLLNRRALEEAFDVELARAGRGRFGVGLVMLDLDGFKHFNDEHGHQAGDTALRRLSEVLVNATRAIDRVGRVGGEEFAILAPESGTAGTLALAERLRRAVEVEFSAMGGLTASCGVASYPENGPDRHALVGAADRALYEAKAQGRNRAVASEDAPAARSGAVAR